MMENELYTPRRKLTLRKSHSEANLSTALVLYKPPGSNRFLGRNLVALETQNITNVQSTEAKDSFFAMISNKSNRQKFWKLTICFLGIAFFIFVLYTFQSREFNQRNCDQAQVNFEMTKHYLKKSLYGQSIALKEMSAALERLAFSVKDLAILLLFGPSGTGKTFTLNLFSQNLPSTVKQFRFHLPLVTVENIKIRLQRIECCRWNFIFIEDSDYAEIGKIEEVIKTIQTIYLNIPCKDVKIVMMFTSSYGQNELDQILHRKIGHESEVTNKPYSSEILDAVKELASPIITVLKLSNLNYTSVPYLPLGKEEIEACIVADLLAKKRKISQSLIDRIMANIQFWPFHSKQFAESGCKPVSTQVNLHI